MWSDGVCIRIVCGWCAGGMACVGVDGLSGTSRLAA